MKPLPSSEQIQSWVLGITPSEYFERIASPPGMLLLRSKNRVSSWRGLHFALSNEARECVRDQLQYLASRGVERLHYQCSLPDGRAWFELYTSGIDFGSWWKADFELDAQASPDSIFIRYVHSTVHIRLSEQSASLLAAELARPPLGGVKSSLKLVRELRPSSESHALWLWHWPAQRSAG